MITHLSQLAAPKIIEEDWDYRNANTKEFTHCYHAYPAMMIPQLARRLIGIYGPQSKGLLFDPFCGSGTALVEGLLAGYNVVGTDINPLAILISRAKCSLPEQSQIQIALGRIRKRLEEDDSLPKFTPSFKNIDFWYYKPAIIALASLKQVILEETPTNDVRDFLLVVFSETARESSRTKLGEFKLVRRKENGNSISYPEVHSNFISKVNRNLRGLESFKTELKSNNSCGTGTVSCFNTVTGIPAQTLRKNSVDIVVTSPPYGDSTTTVAYGQYSRLSSQWLDIEDAFRVDRMLMGGRKIDKLRSFEIPQLDAVIQRIAFENKGRAEVVAAFYDELEKSCINVAKVIKPLGYACYVTSNRRVMGVTLPTDSVVETFFERCGFHGVAKYFRNIPNKRMPSKNSPTNIAGVVDVTMTKECITVMQKLANN